jgi:hypothetical protein
MPKTCEMTYWTGSGWSRTEHRCTRRAAWTYVNGAYRRLECQEHAEQTRKLIKYPDDIWLELLPASTGGEVQTDG